MVVGLSAYCRQNRPRRKWKRRDVVMPASDERALETDDVRGYRVRANGEEAWLATAIDRDSLRSCRLVRRPSSQEEAVYETAR